MLVAIAGAMILGLVILYLTRPYYLPIVVSSARFLVSKEGTPAPMRFSLRSANFSLPFWVKLLVFGCILLALLWVDKIESGRDTTRVGVWIAVDTSASMTTIQPDGTRADKLIHALVDVKTTLMALEGDRAVCTQVWAFDQELRELSASLMPSELDSVLAALTPRTLGTDISLIGRLGHDADTARREASDTGECAPTHLIILSDQPEPPALAESIPLPVVWYSLGGVSENYGIVDLQYGGATLGGITVVVGAWGGTNPVEVTVSNSEGRQIAAQEVRFEAGPQRSVRFDGVSAGQITVSVSPGGSYAHDDEATVVLGDGMIVRVDWQASSDFDPVLLGWAQDADAPLLRVQSWRDALLNDGIPTLLIGEGFGGPTADIDRFVDVSPLLSDINLDVAERLGVRGVRLSDDSPLIPVLIDVDDAVWFAQSTTPPLALVPSVPILRGDSSVQAFSSTGFFNAVAWLLRQYRPPPLYTLTSPALPTPDVGRLVLHSGEGDTSLHPAASGNVLSAVEWSATPAYVPIWPILVVLAVAFFTVERYLTIVRGRRWH